MTQAELAQHLGIDANGVSRYEKGKVAPPSKAYPVLVRVLQRPREYFVDEPIESVGAPEPAQAFAAFPNLRALMQTTDWAALSERARAEVLDESNRASGDLPIEEWALELRRARRRHPPEGHD